MKKKFFTILLFFSALICSSAQDSAFLETGAFLFINPGWPGTVYIDGKTAGKTPLFISDLSAGARMLQIHGDNRFCEIKLKYNSAITETTVYSPSPENYYGYLSISSPENPDLFIDGEPVSDTESWLIKLDSGPHEITASGKDYLSRTFDVIIPELETAYLTFSLKRAHKLQLTPSLPENTTITLFNTSAMEKYSFTESDEITLSSGKWLGEIYNPDYERAEFSVIIADKDCEIQVEMVPSTPKLKLSGLKPESRVFLNDIEVTALVSNGILSIQPGKNQVSIFHEEFLPIVLSILGEGSTTSESVLEYVKNPEYARKKGIKDGIIIGGIGSALAAAGLLATNNSFLSSVSPDYDTYKILKYTTLGTTFSGLIVAVTGGVVSGYTLLKY